MSALGLAPCLWFDGNADDPDPAVAQRVTAQMLTMVKLDIAPLEAAAKAAP